MLPSTRLKIALEQLPARKLHHGQPRTTRYQAISGEWVVLTPGLQLLRSPPETASTQAVSGEGSPQTRSQVGTYQEGTLFRWAEYHQHQFRRRLTEQSLGPYALSIIGGHQLQTSSTTQEYCKFLKALRPVRDRVHQSGTSFFQSMQLVHHSRRRLLTAFGVLDRQSTQVQRHKGHMVPGTMSFPHRPGYPSSCLLLWDSYLHNKS